MDNRPRTARPPHRPRLPAATARRHGIRVMLSDHELGALEALATREERPLATVVYRLVRAGLARAGKGA